MKKLLFCAFTFTTMTQCAVAEPKEQPKFFQILYENPANVEQLEQEILALEDDNDIFWNINIFVDADDNPPLNALLIACFREDPDVIMFPYKTLDLLLRYGARHNYEAPPDNLSFCQVLQQLLETTPKHTATIIQIHNFTNNWVCTHS